MARIRTIKPDFWTDEKVVELSPFARLLFIGLWNFADDEGRMEFSEKRIAMQIFPADPVDIADLFGELRGQGLIEIYTAGVKQYLVIPRFGKHQKVDKRTASRHPPPPGFYGEEDDSEIPNESPNDSLGREGNGKEGKGTGGPPVALTGTKRSAKSASRTAKTTKGVKEDFAAFWQAYPHKVGKAAAEKAYAKARKGVEQADLLIGLEAYIASKPEDRPWCNPSTWLNQQRWLDQPSEIPAKNRKNGRGGTPRRDVGVG